MLESDIDQHLLDIEKEYLEFLDDEDGPNSCLRRVKEMIENQRVRILIDYSHLRDKKPERAAMLLINANDELYAFQNALKQYVSTVDPEYTEKELYIGFEGTIGSNHVTPRTLTSPYINKLVCLEGIVSQCSLIRPKLVRSVHYCPTTEKISERLYSDFTSLKPMYSTPIYPTRDVDGNLLETEYGLSKYKDHQSLVIQEMPETAPAGQLPRAVSVICDNDLADKCKPGDRIQIYGLYRCLPSKQNGRTNAIFKTVLLANNIQVLSKDCKIALSRTDIANCRKLARKKNVFEVLSRSLAPSIHGHEYVKKAILCMLLGGVEKVLPNGTRLRGDINILLIGDPSVAKSQLLRYVLNTAPRAITTTGRGSSGVGLTAAVTSDPETGERRLEAGAMVLADRGIVCIDEFDKMSDIDRTAIHEVMEQGRVTIAKAGIHAQLNARCSVLAAANPVYGKYDPYKPPMDNIGLQDSLLSRFDLLFVILDTINSDIDSIISDHVVRMHRYRDPLEKPGAVMPFGPCGLSMDMEDNEDKDKKEPEPKKDDGTIKVFEKYNELLHGQSRSRTDKVFTVEFMKIYIYLAKTLKPKLTDEAAATICEEYARLRSQDAVQDGEARTQPVTVRTLETLIRLATAHAKARLSYNIENRDAEAAIELVQYAYFKKVLVKDKKRKKRQSKGSDSENDDDDDSDEEVRPPSQKRNKRLRSNAELDDLEQDVTLSDNFPRDEVSSMEQSTATQPSTSAESTQQDEISDERHADFRLGVSRTFQQMNSLQMRYKELVEKVNEKATGLPFSESEIRAAFKKMQTDNHVMISDDIVFLI